MRQKSFVSLCRGGCVAAALLGVGLLQASSAFAGMGRMVLSADGSTASAGRDIYSVNPIFPLVYPHVLSEVGGAEHAVVSPNGKKILFTSEASTGTCGLFMADSDGQNEVKVQTNPAEDVQCSSPAWSPGGDRILWVNRDSLSLASTKLYSAKLDGSDVKVIASVADDELVYDPDYSPDGKKVVYSFRANDLTWSLITVDSSGGSAKVIYSTADIIANPTWSPDGKKIAFEVEEAGKSILSLIDEDGSGYSQFTSSTKRSSSPIWSKDGRSLIYVEYNSASRRSSVLIRNLDGSPAQSLNQRISGYSRLGGYSSDGTIAAVKDSDLALLYADGEELEGYVASAENNQDHPARIPGSDRMVYRDENGVRGFGSDLMNSRVLTSSGASLDIRRLFDTDESESDPAVSPDGKRVVFVRTTVFPFESGIYTADAQTGLNEQLVVKGDVSVSDPSWSPDGSKIVYSVDNPFSGWDVYKVNADGSGGEVALTNVRGSESSAVWSPVNNRVLFVAAGNIYSIEADGTDRKLLTSTPTVAENNLSVSTDGQWILYDGGNGKVYAMRPDGSRQTVLVDGLPGASHPTW